MAALAEGVLQQTQVHQVPEVLGIHHLYLQAKVTMVVLLLVLQHLTVVVVVAPVGVAGMGVHQLGVLGGLVLLPQFLVLLSHMLAVAEAADQGQHRLAPVGVVAVVMGPVLQVLLLLVRLILEVAAEAGTL
jgi:hypothetical protein